MRKKYLSALLFGALLVTSAGTFTSCKDYDDDINSLQEQVDALKNKATVSPDEMKTAVSEAIAALEAKLNEAISGKADAAEVKELIEKVTELQNLVNSNEEANEEQIKRLQKEIADLTEKVNSIPGELDKIKADLAAQKTELEGEIAKLQEQINEGKVAQGQLNTKLDDLKALLEQITGSDKEELLASIAELQNQITANADKITALETKRDEFTSQIAEINTKLDNYKQLIDNNGQAIAEIQTAIADLQDLRDDITSLQNLKADKTYVDAQIEAVKALIPTDYLTAEGVNDVIESALGNYVSLEFMAAYSTTAEMQTYVGNEIAAALVTVNQKIEQAFKDNGYNKADFEAVVKHMNDVNTALKDAEFENIADLINTVKTLEGSYATSEAVEALNKIINGEDGNGGLVADVNGLKSWQTTTDTTISSLNTKISTLVSSLRSMIQSISIVPFNDSKDTDITFNSLYFVGDDGPESLTVSKERTVTLKVSPASALTETTFADDYTVSVIEDKFASRSDNDSNFKVEKTEIISQKEGLIKVYISSTKDIGSTPLCINVQSTAEETAENGNVKTNINSDYFIAKTSTWYIIPEGSDGTEGKWFELDGYTVDTDLTVDKTDADEEVIDFKAKKAEIRVGTTKDDSSPLYKDIKDLDLPEGFVNIEYAAEQSGSDNQPFMMKEGVLKYIGDPEDNSNALAGKKGKVKATLTLGEGEKAKTAEFTTNDITLKIIDQCIVDIQPQVLNLSAHTHVTFSDKEYEELKAKFNITNWEDKVFNYDSKDGAIGFWARIESYDGKPFVYINKGTIQESAKPIEHVYGNVDTENLKVTLKANVAVGYKWDGLTIQKESQEWTGEKQENILIPFVYSDNDPELKFGNLTTIFSNYDEIVEYVKATYGAEGVKFAYNTTAVPGVPSDRSLVTLNDNALTVDPSKYNGELISVDLYMYRDDTEIKIPGTTAGLQMSPLHDLSGQIVPYSEEYKEISIELNKVEGQQPTSVYVLKDGQEGPQKWDWKIMYDGEWKSAYTKLRLYNLKFELDLKDVKDGEELASDWLTVSGTNYDTQIQIKADKYQLANLQRDLVFTIPVVFTSPWQAMQPNSFSEVRKNITVTIKAWSANPNVGE